jgi:hypothetical protein
MEKIINNPFAAPAYDGVVSNPGMQFVDQDATYVYNIVLTANQELNNEIVQLDNDADFLLMGIQVTRATSSLAQVLFADNQGQQLSNDFVYLGAFSGGGNGVPFTIVPARIFSRGGQIQIRIADLSGAQNTIQIAFRGVKRYSL